MVQRKPKSPRQVINMPELEGLDIQRITFVVEYLKDFNARRAAEAAHYSSPDYGYKLIKDDELVKKAITLVTMRRMQESDIDAEWLLYEAVDNHRLARQAGNLSASNAALQLVGKIATVDAFAADKLELLGDKELVDRLNRGRKRAAKKEEEDEGEGHSFL